MTESEVVAAARDLAWWTHANLSTPELYRQRRAAFARLRAALRGRRPRAQSPECAVVIDCAADLAACSDSNRWGEPYYIRRSAFARLRGALGAYDATPTTSTRAETVAASPVAGAPRPECWRPEAGRAPAARRPATASPREARLAATTQPRAVLPPRGQGDVAASLPVASPASESRPTGAPQP